MPIKYIPPTEDTICCAGHNYIRYVGYQRVDARRNPCPDPDAYPRDTIWSCPECGTHYVLRGDVYDGYRWRKIRWYDRSLLKKVNNDK